MSELRRAWLEAATNLGLEVEGPTTISLDGAVLIAAVVVRGFGAHHGMVLVTSYADLAPHIHALVEAGYGFCVIGQPLANEVFDRDSFVEILSDWGWTGEVEERPHWLLPLHGE